jgi:hypothetical protein
MLASHDLFFAQRGRGEFLKQQGVAVLQNHAARAQMRVRGENPQDTCY